MSMGIVKRPSVQVQAMTAKSADCEFKSAEMLRSARTSAMRVAGAAFEHPRQSQLWAGHASTAVVSESHVVASADLYPTEVLVAIVPFL